MLQSILNLFTSNKTERSVDETVIPTQVPSKPDTIFCAIAACDMNLGIGKDNKIPWRSPQDLMQFKERTMGKIVIMGRKTWESLPEYCKPLVGRTCIVVTQDTNYKAKGATVLHSVESVLDFCTGSKVVYVMGGSQIYALFSPIITSFCITRVHAQYDCDTYLPHFPGVWRSCKMDEWVEEDGVGYSLEYGWRSNE